jgi:hypothetical protein
MAKLRQRRRTEKERRHADTPAPLPRTRDLETTSRVKRLACTRKQAAEALGVSLATLDRRVIPAIETVRTEWGSRLIPVDERERYLAERRQEARAARRRPARPGRKPGLEPEVVARIRGEHASWCTLGGIARHLNAGGVRTSQGGRQWWPSTVRAVLVRSQPLNSAERR